MHTPRLDWLNETYSITDKHIITPKYNIKNVSKAPHTLAIKFTTYGIPKVAFNKKIIFISNLDFHLRKKQLKYYN
jgi:hypothetical protein